MASRSALRFARSLMNEAMGICTQQMNAVEQNATQVLRGYVTQVNGGIWRGPGAQRFIQVVQSDMVPLVSGLVRSIVQVNRNLTDATEAVDNGDRAVKTIVDDLRNTYEQI